MSVLFKPIQVTEDKLDLVEIKLGNIIFCVDSGKIYLDTDWGDGGLRRISCSEHDTDTPLLTEDIALSTASEIWGGPEGGVDKGYSLEVAGYILSISAYTDDAGDRPIRYNTSVSYNASSGISSIWMSSDEYDYFMGLEEDKRILRVDYVPSLNPFYNQSIRSVAELSTSAEVGTMVYLVDEDSNMSAPAGVYIYDGLGWVCLSWSNAYGLGSLGSDPTLNLISGVAYTALVSEEIDTWTVNISRPGVVSIRLSNPEGHAVAPPLWRVEQLPYLNQMGGWL